jgi:hypothetical protein
MSMDCQFKLLNYHIFGRFFFSNLVFSLSSLLSHSSALCTIFICAVSEIASPISHTLPVAVHQSLLNEKWLVYSILSLF